MNKETPAPRPTTGDYVETHWDELDPRVQAYYTKKQEIEQGLKADENPEGLSLYEQAQRDKYLDEGETSQSAEKSKAQQELDAARLAFAKARVDVESHFFKEWFGGKKRKEALQEAADKLKACELAVAKEEMASQIEQLNQLSGEELAKQQELFAQMMAARAFQGMQETAQKTTEAYD